MADKRRFLDVWIIESNTVYQEVPYTVVADWVQEGRLLENDMLRPSGTQEWFPVGRMPAFAAYLPKVEPYRAEDQAEALEPVQLDFGWKPRTEDADEDVDMIPLIDVSLVLLIFFMMTASVAGAGALFNTPEARNGVNVISGSQVLWIGIERLADGSPRYSLGKPDANPEEADRNLNEAQALERLDVYLGQAPADVTIKADRELPYEVIKQFTVQLEKRRARGVLRTYATVTERTE